MWELRWEPATGQKETETAFSGVGGFPDTHAGWVWASRKPFRVLWGAFTPKHSRTTLDSFSLLGWVPSVCLSDGETKAHRDLDLMDSRATVPMAPVSLSLFPTCL